MSATSSIEWTDATWNPVTGCTKVSPGCAHCYAETFSERFRGTSGHHFEQGFDLVLRPERLEEPLRWKKPRRVFVCSMSDLFQDGVPDEFIARVWQAMGCAPQHHYQVLTKRPERARDWLTRWYSGDIREPSHQLPVPGFPGYSITTHGTVLGRRSDTTHGLAVDVGEQGHRRVTMHRAGSPRSGEKGLVHRLVLQAFVREPRQGEQACHRNGDPADNRLSNLYWGTQEDNWKDRIRHGNGRAWSKLTHRQAHEIRVRCDRGEPAAEIGRDYDISDTQVRNIGTGKQWNLPTDVCRVEPPARAVLDCAWIGVSAEDQKRADERIPVLLDTPAAVRFVSVEPMLGPIDMACATQPDAIPALDWVICGGESGHGARPMHPDWARALRDQCVEAGVPFFFKQWGEWAGAGGHPKNLPHAFVDYSGRVQRYNAQDPPPVPCYEPACMARPGKKAAGRELDGRTWDEMPEAAAV